jgi:hypothetical protein
MLTIMGSSIIASINLFARHKLPFLLGPSPFILLLIIIDLLLPVLLTFLSRSPGVGTKQATEQPACEGTVSAQAACAQEPRWDEGRESGSRCHVQISEPRQIIICLFAACNCVCVCLCVCVCFEEWRDGHGVISFLGLGIRV